MAAGLGVSLHSAPHLQKCRWGVVEAWDADQTEANNHISFSLSGARQQLHGPRLGAGVWAGSRRTLVALGCEPGLRDTGLLQSDRERGERGRPGA